MDVVTDADSTSENSSSASQPDHDRGRTGHLGTRGALFSQLTAAAGALNVPAVEEMVGPCPRIVARAAALQESSRLKEVWGNGVEGAFVRQGQGETREDVIGRVFAVADKTPFHIGCEMRDVLEGEEATCIVDGLKNERQAAIVEEITWEMACLLRGQVIKGERWTEVHIRIHIESHEVDLVESDSLSAAVFLVLLSANWQVPLRQDILVSARVMPNLKLLEVGCIKEKVGVANADTSFCILVTANEVD